MCCTKHISSLILVGLLLLLLPPPSLLATELPDQQKDTLTNSAKFSPLQVAERAGQVEFVWQLPFSAAELATISHGDTLWQDFPQRPHAGTLLPFQTQTIVVDSLDEPQLHNLQSIPWQGSLRTVAEQAEIPTDADGRELAPALTAATTALPTSPFFVLRQGRLRGHQLVVVAVSPIYATASGLQLASSFQASLPGRIITPEIVNELITNELTNETLTGPAPSNPAANQAAVKVVISESGLHQIRGSALLETGLQNGSALAKLRLINPQGAESALEILDADGLLDTNTVVHFYAPPTPLTTQVGDRWNSQEIYWLTVETADGLRMNTRSVGAGTAPLRNTGLDSGVWENNQIYESTMPGIDGDHWFAATLSALPDATPADIGTLSVELESDLPLALEAGTQLTITGSARTIGDHSLNLTTPSHSVQLDWTINTFYEGWQLTTTLPQPATALTVSMVPSLAGRLVETRVDKVLWQLPVRLEFNGEGATFWGVADQWRYALKSLPSSGALYNITHPLQPQRLTIPWATQLEFEDGPTQNQYLVADYQQLASPTLVAHNPVDFTQPTGADAIYLAPQAFFAALTPLIEHRRQQGYRVALVDLQQVYDAWSFGQVSPDAIRNFLRYAVANWSPTPLAVTLVGDATTDPRNYLGSNNPNILPAYFAYIDPWLGEAACEPCFAQLDGESPLDQSVDPGFLVDIWLGRLSAQNVEQLQAIVNKILTYESAPSRWQSEYFSLYIADNYVQPDGTLDLAGDFAYYQDLVVEGVPAQGIPPIQSSVLPARRVYYDPDPIGRTEAWREPDAVRARQRVIQQMQQMPSLVVYNGHANHFQLASTVRNLPEPFLFGTNDIFLLENQRWLPIVLQMTCMTSQFTQLSTSGTTLDERLQRETERGAVAVWGSAGLSVTHGHQSLLRGFHQPLWSQPPGTARLGELVNAGYVELFSAESCCQETRQVFVLLGDPLTPARVWETDQHGLFLPVIQD